MWGGGVFLAHALSCGCSKVLLQFNNGVGTEFFSLAVLFIFVIHPTSHPCFSASGQEGNAVKKNLLWLLS